MLGASQELLQAADDLGVGGADVLVGQERVSHRVEQATVELLAADHLLEEAEQRLAGVLSVEQLAAVLGGLAHPLDHDRRDQVLLGREVAEQRAATDPRPLGDLGHSHLQAALLEQGLSRVQEPPAVSLRVGP